MPTLSKTHRPILLAAFISIILSLLSGCSTPGRDIEIEDRQRQSQLIVTKEIRWDNKKLFIDAQIGIERISDVESVQALESGYVNPDHNQIDAPATLYHNARIDRFVHTGRIHWNYWNSFQLDGGASIDYFDAKVNTTANGTRYNYSSHGLSVGGNIGHTINLTDYLSFHLYHQQGLLRVGGDIHDSRIYFKLRPFKHFALNAGGRVLKLSDFSNETSDIHFEIKGPWLGIEAIF